MCYPSLYEGFGLPPLEAMACGCPVLSSNAGSLPEVVGAAGILISPVDEDEWVGEITRLCTVQSLWSDLRKRGLRQAERFSWDRTARQTVDIYERLHP